MTKFVWSEDEWKEMHVARTAGSDSLTVRSLQPVIREALEQSPPADPTSLSDAQEHAVASAVAQRVVLTSSLMSRVVREAVAEQLREWEKRRQVDDDPPDDLLGAMRVLNAILLVVSRS